MQTFTATITLSPSAPTRSRKSERRCLRRALRQRDSLRSECKRLTLALEAAEQEKLALAESVEAANWSRAALLESLLPTRGQVVQLRVRVIPTKHHLASKYVDENGWTVPMEVVDGCRFGGSVVVKMPREAMELRLHEYLGGGMWIDNVGDCAIVRFPARRDGQALSWREAQMFAGR